MENELLTIAEVAKELRCSVGKMYGLVEENLFRVTFVGKRKFISRSELTAYIKRMTTKEYDAMNKE